MLALIITWAKNFLTRFGPYLPILIGLASVVWYIGHLKAIASVAESAKVQAMSEVTTSRGVIDAQVQSINDLVKLRQQDAAALASLNESYAALDKRQAAETVKRTQLEKTNAKVKNYLDIPVPDELRSLLNSRAAVAGTDNKNASAESPTTAPDVSRPAATDN